MPKKVEFPFSIVPVSDKDRKKYIAELKKNPNNFPLCDYEGRPSYGLPCACLICRHEDFWCTEDPCSVCSGELEEITTGFCIPED